MAAAASSTRSSNRASQKPLSFAEEQAAATLSLLEQRDLAAALRLSLNDDWNSDEEKSGADSDDNAEAAVQSEEEAMEEAVAEDETGHWTSNLRDIDLPLHRLRHPRQQSPSDATPLQLLQRFLPHSLMEEFARHTNAAAPHDWRPTTADELYAFLGVHLFFYGHQPSASNGDVLEQHLRQPTRHIALQPRPLQAAPSLLPSGCAGRGRC
jgi:hypothetical protein